MPVAAAPPRTPASPNDHAAAGGPAGRVPRRCRRDPGRGAGAVVDVEMVVAGYLSAVAAALHERGIVVTTMALDGTGGQDPTTRQGPRAGVSCGTLNLRPTVGGQRVGPGSGWGPTQVDWHPDTGWSARLRRGSNGHLTRWRYLHGALVPPPAVVAGFVAALGSADDIGQPTPAVFGERHRRVLTELGRFAVDDPW